MPVFPRRGYILTLFGTGPNLLLNRFFNLFQCFLCLRVSNGNTGHLSKLPCIETATCSSRRHSGISSSRVKSFSCAPRSALNARRVSPSTGPSSCADLRRGRREPDPAGQTKYRLCMSAMRTLEFRNGGGVDFATRTRSRKYEHVSTRAKCWWTARWWLEERAGGLFGKTTVCGLGSS